MEPNRIPFAPSEYRVGVVRKGIMEYVSQHLNNLPKVKLDEWLWKSGAFYDKIGMQLEQEYIDNELRNGGSMSEKEKDTVAKTVQTYLKADIEHSYLTLGRCIIRLSLQLEKHGELFLQFLRNKGLGDSQVEVHTTETIAEAAEEYLRLPNRSKFMTAEHIIDSAYRTAVREYFQDMEHVLRSSIGDKEIIKEEIRERYKDIAPEDTPLLGFELNHLTVVNVIADVKISIESLLRTEGSMDEVMSQVEKIPRTITKGLRECGYEFNAQGAREHSAIAAEVLQTYFGELLTIRKEEEEKLLQMSWEQFRDKYPKVWSKLIQKKDKAHVIKSLDKFYNKNVSNVHIDIEAWKNDSDFWKALEMPY